MVPHGSRHACWLRLVFGLAFAFGVGGCLSGPAPEQASEEEEALTLPGRLCGGPRGLTCGPADFCSTKAGTCPGPDQLGLCKPRPRICPDIFDPVCGCDGKTYPNACRASAAGTSVSAKGECASQKVFCGGIAGISCPGAGRCVDDPSDDCDPKQGGADCSGMCVCIQTQLCLIGSHFDSSPKVCACVPDTGSACGRVTCPQGEDCCNASCGICTPPGRVCIQIACE